MGTNKRKTTTAIVAGVAAVALLIGGTFAWTSIQQEARNEAIVDINPGGRLHDDFNGTNKDVYVENFGDETTGVPIFARIRLDQYFEVGQEAGKNKNSQDDRNVKVEVGGVVYDEGTWVTYKPVDAEGNPLETLSNPVVANGNWQWTLGNDADNLPYYMPTFNKNKDSLAADINGTYEGTTEDDIVHYDDYVVYVDAEGNLKTVAGTEVYDWDEDTNEEDEESEYDNGGVTDNANTPIDDADVYHKSTDEDGNPLTHTAKPIDSTATVITMAEWINDYNSEPGPYWVYDTDGWAYWAQPIEPGTTTGLLLDSINMSKVPDDNWYYGINVVGQFATKGDIYQFEDMSPAAEKLFGIVTDQEESVVITGADTIFSGNTATYTATRMVLGTTAANQPSFVWTATDADGNAIEDVTMNNGELTVADTVAPGTQITVTATAGDGTAATDGETTVLAGSKTVTVIGTVDVVLPSGAIHYPAGEEWMETLGVVQNGTPVADGTFTWSVTDGDGNKPADTTVANDGTLTVGANETAHKLIVNVTYTPADSSAVYTGSYEIFREGEVATTDELTATAYALVVPNDDGENSKSLVFVRSSDPVTADYTYEGKDVEQLLTLDENYSYLVGALAGNETVTRAVFANTIKPATAKAMFVNLNALKSIDFNGNLDLSDVTDFTEMFAWCSALEHVDMSGLKISTDKLLCFDLTFRECTQLKEIILPKDIKLDYLGGCFEGCKLLTTATNLDTWDVSKVQHFEIMFADCKSLTELDISNWDTSSATEIYSMFLNCEKLNLDCSNWNVANVTRYGRFNEGAPGVKAPIWPETTTE